MEKDQDQDPDQEQQRLGKEGGEEGARGLQLPRVTIQFCTQCRWMLRAAYFAQELLSTFGTDIGEVALQPSTGGTFIVELFTDAKSSSDAARSIVKGEVEKEVRMLKHTLWDRKSEGGFPETKELKKRLRNIIDPSRDLGHVDGKKKSTTNEKSEPTPPPPPPPPPPPEKEKETLNERGKIVVTALEGEGGGFGVCRPGDGECGGF